MKCWRAHLVANREVIPSQHRDWGSQTCIPNDFFYYSWGSRWADFFCCRPADDEVGYRISFKSDIGDGILTWLWEVGERWGIDSGSNSLLQWLSILTTGVWNLLVYLTLIIISSKCSVILRTIQAQLSQIILGGVITEAGTIVVIALAQDHWVSAEFRIDKGTDTHWGDVYTTIRTSIEIVATVPD